MPGVLVTNADEPLGQRLVKTFFHDSEIGALLAVGNGPSPRSFDRFLADSGERVEYVRVDLARSRSVSEFFRSHQLRQAAIDTVVHVPRHAVVGKEASVAGGLAVRTAEARLILHHSLALDSIRHLVALGSAFAYRLEPGNANRVRETSELDLAFDTPVELRSWIDCDMLFHAEVNNPRMRMVLLRVPTVVASEGAVYLNPALSGPPGLRIRPLGFDPLCALITDKDVAKAVQVAVKAEVAGIFNLAATELPLSTLTRWTGGRSVSLPGVLLRGIVSFAKWIGSNEALRTADGAHLRYGLSLDTSRAERDLGFRATYRIALARAGDGTMRLEAVPFIEAVPFR